MSEFREWMKIAGFGAKQVTKAGEAIGIASWYASELSRGMKELRSVDRLAMAAHLAGLKPWPSDPDSVLGKRIKTLEKRIAELETKIAADAQIVEKAHELTDVVIKGASGKALDAIIADRYGG